MNRAQFKNHHHHHHPD
ncbi:his operon leader peptide [Cedecea sp.]|nr:his operon leader peptide [Enterobacteriaceae bacterium RIT693]